MASPRFSATAVAVLVTLLAVVPGCSSEDEVAPGPLVAADGCQPLLAEPAAGAAGAAASPPAPSVCLAPYPSDFHRAVDASTRTGFKLGLRGAARPKTPVGADADPHDVVRMDGASMTASIVGALPGDVVRDGLPGALDEPSRSARAESATILMEAATGAFVPHYTDVAERKEGTHSPIVVRAFSPLKPRTRYVVALAGVKAAAEGATSGELPVARAPAGFARLRDRVADPAIDALAPRFEAEIFAPLERAGVRRERLQLAWDFTTGSAEEPLADMLRVRELTLAWLASNDPAPRLVETRAGTGELAAIHTIELTAPLFTDVPGPGARLFKDASGQVVQNGTATFRVTVTIPKVVAERAEPGRTIALGHGFFGDVAELEGAGARAIGAHLGAVVFGIEWWGMSRSDLVGVTDSLSQRPEHMADFAERVHQAMANWLVTTAAMSAPAGGAARGALARVPELHRKGQVTEPLLYDPAFIGYVGASQGHILGGTLAALDPELSRVLLNVGGGAFTHIMPRSLNFGPLSLILSLTFPDPLLVQCFLGMFARPLDRIDPASYAPHVVLAPLPGSASDRRVLLQIGLGDAGVPNVGSFFHARALGARMTMPSPLSVFGIEPGDASSTAALTLFDYGIDTSPSGIGQPLSPNVVHDNLRLNPRALEQAKAFLAPNGVVTHPCDGPCDPE